MNAPRIPTVTLQAIDEMVQKNDPLQEALRFREEQPHLYALIQRRAGDHQQMGMLVAMACAVLRSAEAQMQLDRDAR